MTDEVDLNIEEIDQEWTCCTEKIPSTEIVFGTQVVLVYIVILVCLVNLSLQRDPRDLWIALLSSALGYILPAPSIPKR